MQIQANHSETRGATTNLIINGVSASESDCKASFTHRTVNFWVTDPHLSKQLDRVSCNRNHLVHELLQCEQGHLICRKCHPKPEPSSPNTIVPCPEHGKPVHSDLCETRELANLQTTCPSNTTFSKKTDKTCLWKGDFRHLGDHLDHCQNIPTGTRVIIQNELIKELKQERQSSNRTIDELTQKMDQMSNQLSELCKSSQMGSVEIPQDRLTNQIRETVSFQITRMQDQIYDQLEDTINHITASRPAPSCDGTLVWKIDNFQSRWNAAKAEVRRSFISPPFFTSPTGYKMCVKMYLNGDGLGNQTHMSAFFCLMKGHYDALLEWPFKRKVTFLLLDQNDVEHAIKAFRPDPASLSFQRPRSEFNIPTGCPLLLAHSELYNREYIKDDTIFLKVLVTT